MVTVPCVHLDRRSAPPHQPVPRIDASAAHPVDASPARLNAGHLTYLCLALLLPAGASPLSAQTADELFSDESMHEIRLFMNSRDLQRLRLRHEDNTFYPADLQWQNVRIRNVAVRSRGRSSRSATKPGLQLEFSGYVSGQRFLGLDTLVLNNQWQEPTLIRERVSFAFFTRMGVAAPRESFCRLFINNTYRGVYSISEGLDASFLGRTFGDEKGVLFEYHNVRRFYAEYLGDSLEPYKLFFEPRTHRLDADTILYSPLRELFRQVNQPHDAVWRDRVDAYLDLEQLLTYLAAATFLAEVDGILGFDGMNNFYLYRPSGTIRHRLIPWDKDLTFDDPTLPILLRAAENELVRRALNDPGLRAFFLQKLEDAVRAAVADDWLLREIDRAAALIDEAVREDIWKPFSNDEFEYGVGFLRDFARRRPGFVLAEIAAVRQTGVLFARTQASGTALVENVPCSSTQLLSC